MLSQGSDRVRWARKRPAGLADEVIPDNVLLFVVCLFNVWCRICCERRTLVVVHDRRCRQRLLEHVVPGSAWHLTR